MRYNSSRYFGSDWGAQAGVNLGFGHHALYANWAHAFNLPGVYAAVNYGGWGQGDRWQELEAEQLDHVEIGWLASIGTSTRLMASLFHDDVENALHFVPPPPPPPQFANIGAYTVDGVELSLQTEPIERLAIFVGGTFSDADPKTVPNLPRATAVGGMTLSGVQGWSLNVDLQWVDERYVLNPRYVAGEVKVGAYFLANAKLSLPLRWLGLHGDSSIFIFGENPTDEEYEYRVGYPMPGRMIQAGVDVRLH